MFDVILLTVTVVALALAGVMGLITSPVLSRERRRSDERVALLVASADREPQSDVARDIRGDANGVTAAPQSDLFAARREAGSGRLLAAVAVAAVALIAVAAIGLKSASAFRPGAAAAAATPSRPLELLVLDHTRVGGHLAIRGVVKNPAGGAPVKGMVAVVQLFDRSGSYIGVSRAPIVQPVLDPGTESRFEIPVTDEMAVGRYRLSFQVETAPVPHVDRRSDPGRGVSPAPSSRVAFDSRAGILATVSPGR